MQEQNYSIKQWSKSERPREKLLLKGSENLTDSELLAILIGSGTRKKSAIDLAREVLLLGKNNLKELGKKSFHDFMTVKGIGEAKAVTIAAALELARRKHSSKFLDKPLVNSSKDIADFLQNSLEDKKHEVFIVVLLNQANKVISYETVSVGGLTCTIVDPRLIIKKALLADAVKIILCHNHPSGSLKPSKADEQITNMVKEAALLMDIRLIDHLIISDEGYYSFSDNGKL